MAIHLSAMPLQFRRIRYRSESVTLDADIEFLNGTFIGLTGPDGSGGSVLLEIAAGLRSPDSGEVSGFSNRAVALETLRSCDPERIRASLDSALGANPDLLIAGPSFSLTDPECQQRTLAAFHGLRRQGAIILLASHDLPLLERHCDEVLVLEDGRVAERGDPQLVLTNYRERIQQRLRDTSGPARVRPSFRHGDGRAEVLGVEILDSAGKSTTLVQSGEAVAVQVSLRYRGEVADPVVGMLIRTRVGVNVYGTNTELEKVAIGPCSAGDEVELSFRFACNLCPQEYTLTIASHDPDGTAHEWLEDAIQFTVSDTRDTAGVANLRAKVEVRRFRK